MKTEKKIEQCEKLLGELKAELLNQKPEFKEGDWVVDLNSIAIYRATSISDIYAYGLNGDKYDGYCLDNLRLATPEEIKAHLIKEAEKRGYKEGVNFSSLIGYEQTTDSLWIDGTNDSGFCSCNICIYREGRWAEIIKEDIILTLDGVDYSESTLRSMIKKATT